MVSGLGVAAAIGLAALLLVPAALGMQRYVIVSGSMTGTYDKGSLVFDKAVPVADLRVGDVITYQPPAGGPRHLVTHRIAWIGRDRNGGRAFRTKGDANAIADPWRFTLGRPTQARVAFSVPYVGYALAALSIPKLRMILVGLPALLIGLAVAVQLWREPEPSVA
jgi:signal peptidase